MEGQQCLPLGAPGPLQEALQFDFDLDSFLDEALALQDVHMEPVPELQVASNTAALPSPQVSQWQRWDFMQPADLGAFGQLPGLSEAAAAQTALPDAHAALRFQPIPSQVFSGGASAGIPLPDLGPSSLAGPFLQPGPGAQQSLFQPPEAAGSLGQGQASVDSGRSSSAGGQLPQQEQQQAAAGRQLTEAELRAQRTKAKNKRAQKKFRQKQRDRQEELQRSTAELHARLKAALAEQDALRAARKALLQQAAGAAGGPAAGGGSQAAEEIFVPSDGPQCVLLRRGIRLEHILEQPRTLTYAQASRLSLQDHLRIFQGLERQLGELLAGGGAEDPASPAGVRLRALLNDRHGLNAWTGVNNPVIMHKVLKGRAALEAEAEPGQAQPAPHFWHAILERLQLSGEQKANLLAARRRYLTSLGRLQAQRRQLRNVMQGLSSEAQPADSTAQHLAWTEAAEQLQATVDAFHVCICILMVSVHSRATGFTAFQEAQFVLLSRPHSADVHGLLQALASAEGEPPAEALMAAGAEAATEEIAADGAALPLDVRRALPLEEQFDREMPEREYAGFVEKLIFRDAAVCWAAGGAVCCVPDL